MKILKKLKDLTKPCHPEERSDVGIASSSNIDLTPHPAFGHPLPQGARNKQQKVAFTLAEVLITLGIIGIVAAMTLPTLNQAINKKVRAEQVRTVKYKFTKATEKMNSLGLIGPYDSTDAFVDELQKHLKIMKRCDASHLRECWPYDEINTKNGAVDVLTLTSGNSLMMRTTDEKDFSSPSVGIVTADGVPMILNYNKKCSALDPVMQYGWSTSDGKPETNATAGCVAAIFEINGGAKPNKYKEDVFAFNSNGLNGECAVGIGANGKCFSAPFAPSAISMTECNNQKNILGITQCCNSNWCSSNDYWGGAVKQCGGVANMPTPEDLAKIATALYKNNPNISGEERVTNNINYSIDNALEMGITSTPPFCIWSSKEDSNYQAYCRGYFTNMTNWTSNTRQASAIQAICTVQ